MSNTLCVLTARDLTTILKDGGSQAWTLDAKRARQCEYVVCIQNKGGTEVWCNGSAQHHSAFVIGRLCSVEPSKELGCENRWFLKFSEYAEIDLKDQWPGYRNPVFYTDLSHFDIDLASLTFKPMPPVTAPHQPGLSMAEAKAQLALFYKVEPGNVDIFIRG